MPHPQPRSRHHVPVALAAAACVWQTPPWLRLPRGHQLLDLTLFLVPCSLDELLMVVRCEMRRQQTNRGQRDVPGFESLEEQGYFRTVRAASIRK
jgi:hypothetical protein